MCQLRTGRVLQREYPLCLETVLIGKIMFKLRPFNVSPQVPENLEFLKVLANNIWWSWNNDATALFRRINPRLFESAGNNPLLLLSRLSQKRLLELSGDKAFLSQMHQVQEQFEREVLTSQHWQKPGDTFRCVGYFSMEYGLHESIHLYSGGLGVLAGDHLKSASDLDLPVVAVGILYREGYFEQQIDSHGQQKEVYPENDVHFMPVTRLQAADGSPLFISIPLPEGQLHAAAWRLDVGRVPLLLLDTNIAQNPPELRDVTGRLYGGDKLTRLRQELLLGIGGVRLLRALNYEMASCHMNEGHAAFLAIERMGVLMRETGKDLETVHELTRRTSIFTTHTPVPAGNETFTLDLVRPHLAALEAENTPGVPTDQVIAWGKAPDGSNGHELSMTILGLSCSYYSNGVSRLHGDVERDMWQHLWPTTPRDEVPIGHVTNGIHVPTWLAPENGEMLERALGSGWIHTQLDSAAMQRIDQIPDDELWRTHEINRSQLIRSAREHAERRLRLRNAAPQEISYARSILDPDALTIGFARRFATYKRATLILRDMERLEKLLTDEERPIQIIFAGKAHPADWHGKELIQRVAQFARNPRIRGRLVFLENYGINLARYLVRGVDIWLNTPRRPNEASGTSGMKVCINGGIHASTLDGWWCEGYRHEAGWAIGSDEVYDDEEYHDLVESQALYNLLETEIIPTFYDRPSGDLPMRWIRMMKASMRMGLELFSSHRMVSDYMTEAYEPSMAAFERFGRDNAETVRQIVADRRAVAADWSQISVAAPATDRDISEVQAGDSFTVTTRVRLNGIAPEKVSVEVYYGDLDAFGKVVKSNILEMELREKTGDGEYLFQQTVRCERTGRFGLTARVRPKGEEWRGLMPGYIVWADWSD